MRELFTECHKLSTFELSDFGSVECRVSLQGFRFLSQNNSTNSFSPEAVMQVTLTVFSSMFTSHLSCALLLYQDQNLGLSIIQRSKSKTHNKYLELVPALAESHSNVG